MDFWWEYYAGSDREYLAIAPLLEYGIESVSTGQFVMGEGAIWSAVASEYRLGYLNGLVSI